jgi:hypothetical protein
MIAINFKTATVRAAQLGFRATIILSLSLSAFAQSWQDKPWTQWSSDECNAILLASPWVTTAQPQDRRNIRHAVLLSSTAVREALLRRMQIDQKYDSMPAERKLHFDKENAICLDDPKYRDNIVVRVWGEPPDKSEGSAEAGQLIVSNRIRISPAENRDAPLTCGGGKFPWEFVPAALNAQQANHPERDSSNSKVPASMDFVYPRVVGGKPLILPSDSTLELDWGPKAGTFTFQIEKLLFKGKPDF